MMLYFLDVDFVQRIMRRRHQEEDWSIYIIFFRGSHTIFTLIALNLMHARN